VIKQVSLMIITCSVALHCVELCYAVVMWGVLCCIILLCSVLCCTILLCNVLHCIKLHQACAMVSRVTAVLCASRLVALH